MLMSLLCATVPVHLLLVSGHCLLVQCEWSVTRISSILFPFSQPVCNVLCAVLRHGNMKTDFWPFVLNIHECFCGVEALVYMADRKWRIESVRPYLQIVYIYIYVDSVFSFTRYQVESTCSIFVIVSNACAVFCNTPHVFCVLGGKIGVYTLQHFAAVLVAAPKAHRLSS